MFVEKAIFSNEVDMCFLYMSVSNVNICVSRLILSLNSVWIIFPVIFCCYYCSFIKSLTSCKCNIWNIDLIPQNSFSLSGALVLQILFPVEVVKNILNSCLDFVTLYLILIILERIATLKVLFFQSGNIGYHTFI